MKPSWSRWEVMGEAIFTYSLFAHFLGDFTFQTNKVALAKSQGIKGIAYHVFICLIIDCIALSIFGWKGFLFAVLNCGIHLGVDVIKVTYGNYLKHFQIVGFFIDQVIHIGILWVLSKMFEPIAPFWLPLEEKTILFLVLIIVITYVNTVMIKQVLFDLQLINIRDTGFFATGERSIDSFYCLIVAFFFAYTPLIISISGLAMISCFYYKIQNKKWHYKYEVIGIKCGLYIGSTGLLLKLYLLLLSTFY